MQNMIFFNVMRKAQTNLKSALGIFLFKEEKNHKVKKIFIFIRVLEFKRLPLGKLLITWLKGLRLPANGILINWAERFVVNIL